MAAVYPLESLLPTGHLNGGSPSQDASRNKCALRFAVGTGTRFAGDMGIPGAPSPVGHSDPPTHKTTASAGSLTLSAPAIQNPNIASTPPPPSASPARHNVAPASDAQPG